MSTLKFFTSGLFRSNKSRAVGARAAKRGRTRLQVEALEDRLCPANTWNWIGPIAVNSPWSNPNNWLHNGAAVPVGVGQQYPGDLTVVTNDEVVFNSLNSGPATLDLPILGIQSLTISSWQDILTLNNRLTVTGALGRFALQDASTINMANANANLYLGGLGTNVQAALGNVWSAGIIRGVDNTALVVSNGTGLSVTQTAAGLGTNMNIMAGSSVALGGMTGNLNLTARANYIDVSGSLFLNQQIGPGRQDLDGGIGFAAGGHDAQLPAIQLETGGTLFQGVAPIAGQGFFVAGAAGTAVFPPAQLNQVSVAGPIYSMGGGIDVGTAQNSLNITGKDASNRSYWQQSGANPILLVAGAGGNISAAGTFQIDVGTVCLTAKSNGVAALDNLDGAGLIFGNANNTKLEITDSTVGVPGTVSIGGPVTLAAHTTTMMNFTNANNTALSDVLNVQNGALVLAGTLALNNADNQPQLPSAPLNFFEDSGASPSLSGSFSTFRDNVGGTSYIYWMDTDVPNDYTWELAIH